MKRKNLSEYNAVNIINNEIIILSAKKLLLLEFLNHSKILSPVINERNAINTYSFSRKIMKKTGKVMPSPVKDLVIKFCLNSCAKPSTHFIKFVDTAYKIIFFKIRPKFVYKKYFSIGYLV